MVIQQVFFARLQKARGTDKALKTCSTLSCGQGRREQAPGTEERAAGAFLAGRLCATEWSWPVARGVTATQLLFSEPRRVSRTCAASPWASRRQPEDLTQVEEPAAQQGSQTESGPGSES